MPELTEKERKQLEKSCRDEYINALTWAAIQRARAAAETSSKELIECIVQSNQIAGHMEILKLIGAHPNNEGTK